MLIREIDMYTVTAEAVLDILTRTGKGFTNEQLAKKVGKSQAAVRAAIRVIRSAGEVPVVKKVVINKKTNKLEPAKYFVPVSQDFTVQTTVPLGRPSRAFAVRP
jgi:transcription initiation factor IIE alpha subunit